MQVDQILTNLCLNARDAIHGAGRIAIETAPGVSADDVLQAAGSLEQASHHVVAAAIEVMTEVGDAQDLPMLRALSTRFDNDPFVGFAADMAIERIEAA